MESDIDVKHHEITYSGSVGRPTVSDRVVQQFVQMGAGQVQQCVAVPLPYILTGIEFQHTVQLGQEVAGKCHLIPFHRANIFLNSAIVTVSPRSISAIAKGELGETMKAFYAAKDSANNIVTGITAQIVRVEKMHIIAHLDEVSVAQVQETNRKAIEQESDVLAQHMKKLKTMFNDQSEELANIVRRGEGVWMSLHVFYIIAPIALFAIFAWMIYISFWVYFHWIA